MIPPAPDRGIDLEARIIDRAARVEIPEDELGSVVIVDAKADVVVLQPPLDHQLWIDHREMGGQSEPIARILLGIPEDRIAGLVDVSVVETDSDLQVG